MNSSDRIQGEGEMRVDKSMPWRGGGSVTTTRLLAGVSVALLLAACSGKEAPLPTLAGPESTKLIAQVSGHIVMDRFRASDRRLVTLSLPKMKEAALLPGRASRWSVHFVSGPNRDGHIVYVERHGTDELHRLKTILVDGTGDRLIFQRPGDVLWIHNISAPALAPEGALVAFVRHANPDYHTELIGPLEMWDVATGTGESTGITAWSERMSRRDLCWFPGSEMLAFEQLMAKQGAPVSGRGFDADFDVTGKVPVVSILDVSTGKASVFHVGVHPLVYPDGKGILLEDASDQWWRIDVPTRHAEPVTWPGNWRGPIALLEGGLILYWGHPTEGSPVRHTKYGSPLVHKHAMGDLKIASLADGQFQTVFQAIDPRREVSFGVAERRSGK